MIRIVLLLISVLSLSLVSCSTSSLDLPEAKPLDPGIHYFQCDAASGYYSDYLHSRTDAIGSVKGEFRINMMRKHRRWLPALTVGLDDQDREHVLAIRLVARGNSNELQAEVVEGTGKESLRINLDRKFYVGDRVPFSLKFPESGGAAVTLGEDENEFFLPISWTPIHLHLSCSTSWGEISIADVSDFKN